VYFCTTFIINKSYEDLCQAVWQCQFGERRLMVAVRVISHRWTLSWAFECGRRYATA